MTDADDAAPTPADDPAMAGEQVGTEDTATGAGSAAGGETPPSVAVRLLDVQHIDTEADQLRLQRDRSPLRAELTAKSDALTEWEQQRNTMRARIDELGSVIESAETQGAELTTHRARLEAQMKTVIAPRAAEALMHEIATIDTQRDELDLRELEAMEEQANLDDALADHLQLEESLCDAVRVADEALAAAVGDIDRRLDDLGARRDGEIAQLDGDVVSTYQHKRDALGVAVAELVGKQCRGCHLDLSAAEIDTVRDEAAATGFTECPQCGRLLVIHPT